MNVFDFARMVEERRAELRLSLPRVTPSMWDNGGTNKTTPVTACDGIPGSDEERPGLEAFPAMEDLTTFVNRGPALDGAR